MEQKNVKFCGFFFDKYTKKKNSKPVRTVVAKIMTKFGGEFFHLNRGRNKSKWRTQKRFQARSQNQKTEISLKLSVESC